MPPRSRRRPSSSAWRGGCAPGYVRALEGGLRRGGEDLEQAAEYSLSDFTIVESLAGLDRAGVQRALGATSGAGPAASAAPPPVDPVVAAIADLRSGDAARLRGALARPAARPARGGRARAAPRPPRRAAPGGGGARDLRRARGRRSSWTRCSTPRRPTGCGGACRPSSVLRVAARPRRPRGGTAARGPRATPALRSRARSLSPSRRPELVVPREAVLGAAELALADGGTRGLLREHLLEPADPGARAGAGADRGARLRHR